METGNGMSPTRQVSRFILQQPLQSVKGDWRRSEETDKTNKLTWEKLGDMGENGLQVRFCHL
jgi:hypothetical protein